MGDRDRPWALCLRFRWRDVPLRWSFLLPAILAFAPQPATAEELPPESVEARESLKEQLELIKEEETISIASRHEQPISEAASNVYVITDEDIRQSGAIDLPTVLRRIPGIEVMQMSAADFNVSARGDNNTIARRLLVMVDGRSIYIDALGFVFWKAIPVTLPEIKRIEVLKGPASALYGFNAVDGIINIITKSPEEIKGTTLQFGGGEFGTISSAAIHAGVQGKLGYRFSYGHDETNQWNNRDSLAYRSNLFNTQLDYALSSRSRVQFSGGIVDVNRFDGPVLELVHDMTEPTLAYARAVYEHGEFLVSAFWNGSYDRADQHTTPLLANVLRLITKSGSEVAKHSANTYNLDVQHSIRPAASHRLTYGTNYRHNTFNSDIIDNFTQENRLGLFLQDEWTPVKSFTAVAGVRYDLDTFINPTTSPRVSLIYTPVEGHTFRATYSVAYRPPTILDERFTSAFGVTLPPPIPSPPPVLIVPTPDLKPEKMTSYELSYEGWYFRHRLRVRTAAFFNHLTDLIIFQASGALANRVNAPGVADLYGGEAGMEFLATSWLSAFANYSYVGIGQSFTDVAQRGAPRSKFNVGLRGEWENGINADATFHYVGSASYPLGNVFTAFSPFFPPGASVPSERVGSYNLLNLRGAYRFWKQKAAAGFLRDAEVAVSAFNALNDKHKEHPLGDTIGSRVMGWLTVRF